MATKRTKILVTIKRYDPETEESWDEKHEVPFAQDMTVLDALNFINENEQPGLSYRYSCRMGICGSCGAMVDGKPVLMCSTFARDCEKEIQVEPLRNFPVVKDLVVDTDNAMNNLRDALPYTNFATKKIKKEQPQTPEEQEKFKQTSQCIKCMLCYSACPVYGLNDKFIGPAAAATAYRYNEDNHDTLKPERMNSLTSSGGVWNCSFIGECSVVCPKKVDPAVAIQKLKIMGALHSVKPSKNKESAKPTPNSTSK